MIFPLQVFCWLRPTLVSLVHLLDLYHNYSSIVELILELYCETAKRILCYFTPSESRALYEASLALVRTYAAHQVGNWKPVCDKSQNLILFSIPIFFETDTDTIFAISKNFKADTDI